MDISGKPVLFHLSAQGRRTLGSLVPRKKDGFRALIMTMDAVGAWVMFPGAEPSGPGVSAPVVLLKWEHIAAVVFEIEPEQPRTRIIPGFAQGKA
jgi:hypothetical protein